MNNEWVLHFLTTYVNWLSVDLFVRMYWKNDRYHRYIIYLVTFDSLLHPLSGSKFSYIVKQFDYFLKFWWEWVQLIGRILIPVFRNCPLKHNNNNICLCLKAHHWSGIQNVKEESNNLKNKTVSLNPKK